MRKLEHFIKISCGTNECRSLSPASLKEVHSSSITTSFRSPKEKMFWSAYSCPCWTSAGWWLPLASPLPVWIGLIGYLLVSHLKRPHIEVERVLIKWKLWSWTAKMMCLCMLAVNHSWVHLALWAGAESCWNTLSLPMSTPSIQIEAML